MASVSPSFRCIQMCVGAMLRKNKPAEFVLKIRENWMNKCPSALLPFRKFVLVVDSVTMDTSSPTHFFPAFLPPQARVLVGLALRTCKCLG